MIIFKTTLKTWLFDYIFKVDNGLWEYEMEYYKKYKRDVVHLNKINRKLYVDRGYNQLQGKLTTLLSLAQDFKIPIPLTDRIKRRIKERKGKLKAWK